LDKVKFDTFIINIFSAIDLWTIVCEKEDEKEKSFPTLRWFDLFASIASFFPNSIYDLNNVESPERCRKESSQYLSWKLGYTIGNCIKSAKKSHIEADQVLDFLIQESIKQNADYKINFVQDTKNIYSALPAIIGIINNVNKTTEWPENRRRALALWKNYKKTDQTPLAQITPGTDLYWAINTGICDSMLMGEILRERSNDFVLSSSDVLNIKKEIDDSTGPSSKSVSDQDIEEALKNRLGSIYDILPEKIIEPLKYCKNNCRTNLEIIHCLVDYDLAIKYWIQRLLTFHLDREINLFKSPDLLRRGQKTSLPSDLANAEWGIIFKDIYRAIPNNPEKRHWIYRATFESYYKKYLNPIQPDDFRRVGEHLQAIGSIRNQVLHESDKEISEKRYRTLLSDMDKLVLGSEGKPGLIKDIYRLFQNNKSQSSEWS
jgi:hypothetical protein